MFGYELPCAKRHEIKPFMKQFYKCNENVLYDNTLRKKSDKHSNKAHDCHRERS